MAGVGGEVGDGAVGGLGGRGGGCRVDDDDSGSAYRFEIDSYIVSILYWQATVGMWIDAPAVNATIVTSR